MFVKGVKLVWPFETCVSLSQQSDVTVLLVLNVFHTKCRFVRAGER